MKSFYVLMLHFAVISAISAQKSMTADAFWLQVSKGEDLYFEGVTFTEDLDWTDRSGSVMTSLYTEQKRQFEVHTRFVSVKIEFKACTFKGRLDLFTMVDSDAIVKEYRLEFQRPVVFNNCVFEQEVDFELANFNDALVLKGSRFMVRPSFFRIGLTQRPDLSDLVLDKGCAFKNYQSDKLKVLSVAELQELIKRVN